MEKTLTSIYLDPSQPASFDSLDAVYGAIKEKGKNKIQRKQVRDWLSQQDVFTLHKPARRRYKRSRVVVFGIDEQFQADLVDLQNLSRYNKDYKYLLTCIDIFSKYAFVLPLKTKQGQELVKAFQKILSTGRNPSNCKQIKEQSSRISCSRNFCVTTTLLFSLLTLGSKPQSFNRTFKNKMYKYFTAKTISPISMYYPSQCLLTITLTTEVLK